MGSERKTTTSRAPTDRGRGIVEWNQDLDVQLAAVQVLDAVQAPVVVRVMDEGDGLVVRACWYFTHSVHVRCTKPPPRYSTHIICCRFSSCFDNHAGATLPYRDLQQSSCPPCLTTATRHWMSRCCWKAPQTMLRSCTLRSSGAGCCPRHACKDPS